MSQQMFSAGRIRTYDYSDVPTIRKFANDDHFVRVIMGPVGCCSSDTMYLSRDGWHEISEYSGEEIAQWENGRMNFVYPINYIKSTAEEMIVFNNKRFSMCLSKEHRVPHYDWNGKFSVKYAEEIFEHPSKIEIPTTFRGTVEDTLNMSDALIRFAVMMHADGHYPKQGRQATVALRRDRKKIRLREILKELDVEWNENVYSQRPTETVFSFIPPYIGKHYHGKWWNTSWRELSVVVDEVLNWDGMENEEKRFYSTNKEDADFIQYAFHATGTRATISSYKDPRNTDWNELFTVYVRTGDNPKNKVFIREGTEIKKIPAPGGMKYCFTVPSGFFIAKHNDSIFVTGNSGKSSGCVLEIGQRGTMQKPNEEGIRRSRWACIRATYSQLQDTTIKTFLEWFPDKVCGTYTEDDHTFLMHKTLPDGTKLELDILFRSLDKPEHIEKLKSMDLTGAWINELVEIPKEIFDILQTRVGRFPPPWDGGATWDGVICDTNPPHEKHWVYELFEKKIYEDVEIEKLMKMFKQPSGLAIEAENTKNLRPNYYQRLCVDKTPEWIRVFVEGKYGYIRAGKVIYPNYSDDFHVAKERIKPYAGAVTIVGFDFGNTPSCAICQITPDTGAFHVIYEFPTTRSYIEELVGEQVRPILLEEFRGCPIIITGDISKNSEVDGRSTYDAIWEKLHIKVIPPSTNSRLPRIESIDKLLRSKVSGNQPSFLLSPVCSVARAGFNYGYRYKKIQIVGDDRYADIPEKTFESHTIEAIQYAALKYDEAVSLVTHSGENSYVLDHVSKDFFAWT